MKLNQLTQRTRILLIPLVLYGLMAGFFYAYSVSVMPGLNDTPPDAAITAMQGINRAVRNPIFFTSFFLTPLFSLIAGVVLYRWDFRNSSVYLLLATLVYSAGVLLPTGAVNVPMNNALALVDVTQNSDQLATIWTSYASKWTLWNNIRGLLCLIAFLLTALSFREIQRRRHHEPQ